MLTPTLVAILRSGRSDFNERFASARHAYPDLRPEEFKEFVETRIDELVRCVAPLNSDRLGEVVMAAYDAGLVLVGQKLAGPGARLSVIDEGWHRIFPEIHQLLASAPARIIPAVCNAIYQLASTKGARPLQWIGLIERLSPECSDVETFLKLGQVAAWHSGLAHFRQNALAVADSLPEHLALAVVEANANVTWSDVKARLLIDPWFDPAVNRDVCGMRVVARVGSFRGFGGLFIAPPQVAASGQHFLVRCDGDCWVLTADVFGSTFHRATSAEFDMAAEYSSIPQDLVLQRTTISFNGSSIEVPDAETVISSAATPSTLALTSRLSHSIVLIALS